MSRRPGARRILLRGVSAAETAVLVEQAIGTRPADAVVQAIHERADGNPFFVGELARLIVADDARTDDELLRRAAVPAGVRDVVGRRLGRLPDETTLVLQAAAVLGRDAELPLLIRVADLEVAACIEALEPAITDRLVAEVDGQPGTFRFSHALVREVVLSEVTTLRRAQLHQRCAQAIVEVVGDTDDTAEIVADHLWSAVALGGQREAAGALERAADVAIRRFAYESAEDMLERATRLRRTAGATAEDLEDELIAISRLVMVRRMRRGYRGSVDDQLLDRARDLAHRVERLDILNHLLWTEWAGAATACDLVVAERLARQLLDLARESDDPLIKAAGHANWGIQCWHVGRIVEAAEYLDLAIEMSTPEVLNESLMPVFAVASAQLEPLMLGLGFHVCMHELIGDIDDGAARLRSFAESQVDPYGECVCWGFEGFSGMVAGDPARAARAGRMALAAERDESFPFFGGAAGMYVAWALSEFGEHADAIALFEAHLPRYRGTGVRTILPVHLTHFGVARMRAGELEAGAQLVADAEAMLAATGELWTLPFVLIGRAEVQHRLDAPREEVAAILQRAADVATAQGSLRIAQRAGELAAHLGVADLLAVPAPANPD